MGGTRRRDEESDKTEGFGDGLGAAHEEVRRTGGGGGDTHT